MISKIVCFFALVALVAAQHGNYGQHDHGHHDNSHHHARSEQYVNRHDGHQQEVIYHKHGHHDEHGHGHEVEHVVDYHAHPKYEFEYKVEDKHTGDIKSQHEARDGSHTKGYYGLVQPDGHERHVHYQDVDKSGFQAEVKYKINHIVPHHHHHH